MPSVKSFCLTSSAQMEKPQRGRGLSYFSGFFFSPTGIFMVQNQGKSQHYMKYLQMLALECLHLRQTDHLIWMSPALQEKLSLPFIPGLLWCNHLLFPSFSVFNIQHFNGWMQGAILLKSMHWYFVGICFTDWFLCRTHEQLIKMMLENLTNTSAWSHRTFNPQGIKINTNNSLPQQTFCLPRSPFNLGTFHTPQKCLY